MQSKKPQAFTLLELMVVVAILMLLASVALPTVGKYLRRSKTTEVLLNIRKIYDGEVAYFYDEHVTIEGKLITKQFVWADTTPAQKPGVDKVLGNWERSGWSAIHFNPDGPTQYCYLVEIHPDSDPNHVRPPWVPGFDDVGPDPNLIAGALIRAYGDVDGDGKLSEFARMLGQKAGMESAEGTSAIFTFDELE